MPDSTPYHNKNIAILESRSYLPNPVMFMLVPNKLTLMDVPERKDLRESNFIGTNFQEVDLDWATLAGANLMGANLEK